jgi:16S rRNA (guanine527-N7)-methyltransferase
MQTLAPTREFDEACAAFGIACEPAELAQLGRFLGLLLEATQKVNLTGIRDPEEAWMRHLFDALTILSVIGPLPEGSTIADVGSGGGVPGIPLAIVRPDWQVTCIESTGKKCDFLTEACKLLGLGNVTVLQERAEAVCQDDLYREVFDGVVARAVGRLCVLLEYTVPLAKLGGVVVLTKGQKAQEEIKEAHQALYLLHADVTGTVPTPTGTLVVVNKSRKTPGKYPRGVGEPKRDPLR